MTWHVCHLAMINEVIERFVFIGTGLKIAVLCTSASLMLKKMF